MLFHTKFFFFASAHAKGCVVRGGFLVSADHGDRRRGGLDFRSIVPLALVVITIPTLVAAGRVSSHPRDSIPCHLIFQCS